jgi:hypothetical protein
MNERMFRIFVEKEIVRLNIKRGKIANRLIDSAAKDIPIATILMDMRHNHAEMIRFFKRKIPRVDVGFITGFFNNGYNGVGGFLRNAAPSVQNSINGSNGYFGFSSNIFYGYH